MANHRLRITKLQNSIATAKTNRQRTAPNPFRAMSDDELIAAYDSLFLDTSDIREKTKHLSEEQMLYFHAFSVEGIPRDEAIRRAEQC